MGTITGKFFVSFLTVFVVSSATGAEVRGGAGRVAVFYPCAGPGHAF